MNLSLNWNFFVTSTTKSFICSGQCDIRELNLPKNAEDWLCNKPINHNQVSKNTKCEVVCLEGYDIVKGKLIINHFYQFFIKVKDAFFIDAERMVIGKNQIEIFFANPVVRL